MALYDMVTEMVLDLKPRGYTNLRKFTGVYLIYNDSKNAHVETLHI